MAAACQPNIKPEDNPGTMVEVNPNGESKTVVYQAADRWSIVNDSQWMSVSPNAGIAGKNEITVTFQKNATMKTRSAAFYVLEGDKTTMYSFEQKSIEIISTDNSEYNVPASGSFVIRVKSNMNYGISTSTEWIVLPEQTAYKGGSEEVQIEFGLLENKGTGNRYGSVKFTTSDGNSMNVAIIQAAKAEVNWSRDFFRGILGYRFTGDWCGYCPYLHWALEKIQDEEKGRFNVMCFYDRSSNASLSYSGTSKFFGRYGQDGVPAICLDERGVATGLRNTEFYSMLGKFMAEETESYKAVTAITASTSLKDDEINIHPTIYVKEEGRYNIHVALLENGVVVQQTDYTGLYTSSQLRKWEHNHVVRSYVTPELTGQEFNSERRSVHNFDFTVKMPSGVRDNSKVEVAIYVTRPTVSGPKAADMLTYYSNREFFVDNSIIIALGQSVNLKYE